MALSASLNPEGVSSARTVASSCGSASRASVDASSTVPGEGTIAPPPEASSYSARCTSRFRSADVTRRRPSPRSSQRSAIHVSGVSTRTPSPQGPPASASRTRKTAADEGTRSTGDRPQQDSRRALPVRHQAPHPRCRICAVLWAWRHCTRPRHARPAKANGRTEKPLAKAQTLCNNRRAAFHGEAHPSP